MTISHQGQNTEPPVSAAMASPRERSTPRAEPPDRRESLELRELQTREDEEQLGYSSPSASSGEEYRVTTRRRSSTSTTVRRAQPPRKGKDPLSRIVRFWTQHVTLTVPQRSNRDHFALERTLLAYIRTSVVISMQGVLISQLFRLQQPGDRLRFYVAGKPLAVTCHCVAILVALIGAFRFWRQQGAISVGKVHAGGWELNAVGFLFGAIFLVTLILSIAIIVETDLSQSMLVQEMGRISSSFLNKRWN
ncbi:uncharacterized protein N7496_009046 [Penicillium cataractarum]|uniref:DUF202 domain-containing protein n=1 Tax=Penicillium cataractarum TaxID=2100454 RepID=A0A9W9RZL3_9EURO|nr:uncharacterized protein N7496_009046 [Penicillium cataractarum]KAJ5369286.1 hypothetical protein N7496_009046 [Penicillium cataractarum]